MKIKGLEIVNPKGWKSTEYKGEFDDGGMNTYIPQDIMDKLGLKVGDSVIFKYKGKQVNTSIGAKNRIGLTRPQINKLGYLEK